MFKNCTDKALKLPFMRSATPLCCGVYAHVLLPMYYVLLEEFFKFIRQIVSTTIRSYLLCLSARLRFHFSPKNAESGETIRFRFNGEARPVEDKGNKVKSDTFGCNRKRPCDVSMDKVENAVCTGRRYAGESKSDAFSPPHNPRGSGEHSCRW